MTPTRRDLLLASGATALTASALASTGEAASAAPREAQPTEFPLRLPDMPLHDPYIVADAPSGLYHLYTSNVASVSGVHGVGTMVYSSRDLKRWAKPEVVFLAAADLWGQEGAWAPEVHRWRGRWYLFTTLYNSKKPLTGPPAGQYGTPVQTPQVERGTVIAAADSLLGPFTVLDRDAPIAPATFMTLDGTLFTDDDGRPWMVYAHEWVQKIDGTIEAIPLKRDLSAAAGDPVYLFKGSDATWISAEMPPPSANQIVPYVTDGPQLYRLPGGGLAMLWSTYEKDTDEDDGTVSGTYVETQAVSHSGRLTGPWIQRKPLLRRDSGHGMIFSTLGRRSRKMMVVHRPFDDARGKLYEVDLRRDGVHLGRQRKDLDGGG